MFKHAKKFFTHTFIVLLAASFLTWGANSYFVNTPKSVAIEVNGQKISVSELQTEYDFRLREAEKQFGGKLSPEFLQAIQLGNSTVNRLITSKLALHEAKEIGFRASPNALRQQIINNPAFQDADGNFNKNIYIQSVSNYGFTTPGYEKLLKEDMEKKSLFEIFNTHFMHDDYLTSLFKHQNADMTIRSLMINEGQIGAIPAITPAEIKVYYEANNHRYTTNETRDFTTLVLRADKLKSFVNVAETDARTVYNNDPAAFASEEKRQARHILVGSEEKAIELIDLLDKGSNFDELAQEHSTDVFTKDKGGDLGFFAYADMVENFSDAAFNMDVDAISEPVQSPFGYHIIQVMNIQIAKPQAFEDVKDMLVAEIKEEKAVDLYFDLIDQVEDQIAAGAHLEVIAEKLKLSVDKYSQISSTQSNVTFAADVMPVIFELNEGQISDPILVEGQDTVSVFAELNKVNKERTLNIDEARERIINSLTESKKQKEIADKAQRMLIERQNKNSLAEVASMHGLNNNLFETPGIKRNAVGAPKWLKTNHIDLLFAMQQGQVLSSLVNTPDGMALVEIVSIEETAPDSTELELFKNQISRSWQEDLFAQFMQYKRQHSKIDIRHSSIEYALGASYTPQ